MLKVYSEDIANYTGDLIKNKFITIENVERLKVKDTMKKTVNKTMKIRKPKHMKET